MGPNEGWIAFWRVRLALALYARLPSDVEINAIEDCINLVDRHVMYKETATILANAAPGVQSSIVEHLSGLNRVTRQMFARAPYDKGLDLKIPNTVVPDLQPWER
jgi:hypothetical protein